MRQVLRKVANESVNPTGDLTADGTLALQFIDSIDDLVAHTPFKDARKAYQTLRKAEVIEDVMFRAEMGAGANFTQAGLETALRQQFRQLATRLQKRNWVGWTGAEKDAIVKVVQGGKLQNLTRLAGDGPQGWAVADDVHHVRPLQPSYRGAAGDRHDRGKAFSDKGWDQECGGSR